MNAPPTNAAAPSQPQRSVLLGLFIIWQLLFLAANNFLGLIQDTRANVLSEYRPAVEEIIPGWAEKKGYAWDFVEETSHLSQRWSQATLQYQTWSLFAPGISKECAFPAILISGAEVDSFPKDRAGYRIDGRGRLVLSENEPTNLKSYLRWGNFRLRRYENNLVVYLSRWPDEAPAATAERWRNTIKEHVAAGTGSEAMFLAYVRLRVKQATNSTELPIQVTMLMRHYALKGPDSDLDFVEGPVTVPILRWRPARGDELEIFNPVIDRFEPLHP